MNGNWGGIASRDFERMRADDHGGHSGGGGGEYDPSLDVINTIVSFALHFCQLKIFTINIFTILI